MENRQTQNQDLSARTAAVLFWSIALCCAAIWAFLPAMFHSGYRNDVIELIAVGKEWVPANAKHPALPSWLFETMALLTGKAFIAPFLAGQLCTIVTAWSVWRLARTVLSEKLALIAALAALSQRLLTNESILFNHNLVLLACYALMVYLVFRAFQTDRLHYWIGAGLAIGIGMHGKYPIIMVVVAILLYMSLRPAGRKHWRGIGPYVTTGVAVLVFMPHVIWLLLNDFSTFGYASSSRPTYDGWWFHILSPLKFALSQPLYWIPPLIVLFPAIGWIWTWKRKAFENDDARECERFLFYCAVVPIVFHLLVCAGNVQLRMVFGAPFWCFLSVWLLLRIQVRDRPRLVPKTALCLAAVECVLVIGFFVTFYGHKQPTYVYLPMDRLAAECDRVWAEREFATPCPYVTGDMVLAGHAAYRMQGRPSVHYSASTWSTEADVNRQGGLVIWEQADHRDQVPAWVHQRFPTAEILPDPLVLPGPEEKHSRRAIRMRIAVIPPP